MTRGLMRGNAVPHLVQICSVLRSQIAKQWLKNAFLWTLLETNFLETD